MTSEDWIRLEKLLENTKNEYTDIFKSAGITPAQQLEHYRKSQAFISFLETAGTRFFMTIISLVAAGIVGIGGWKTFVCFRVKVV